MNLKSLEHGALKFLNDNNLLDFVIKNISDNEQLTLAISGGVDSLALMLAFLPFKKYFQVVHVDHAQRLESSEQASNVLSLALALGYKAQSIRLTIHQAAKEVELREARYGVLFKLAKTKVITAHHKDDQLETILMGILRKNRSSCLLGMSYCSYLRFSNLDRVVLRPFLNIPKSNLIDFVKELGFEKQIQEDPSNKDNKYTRNRVRNIHIPELIARHGLERLYRLCNKSYIRREYRDKITEVNKDYNKFYYRSYINVSDIKSFRYALEKACLLSSKKLPSTAWLMDAFRKYKSGLNHFILELNGSKFKYLNKKLYFSYYD